MLGRTMLLLAQTIVKGLILLPNYHSFSTGIGKLCVGK